MGIKWGVLGTANIADWGVIPGMLLADNCELYAIAGRRQEKVDKYVAKFGFEKGYVGYENLLNDPEVQAVYVPLPNDLHKEWVIKALKAKKNVLCEKPIAMNLSEAKEMYAVARENGVILMEAFAYLHSPYVKSLKEIVESGAIGDVQFIETAFYTQGYENDIRLNKENGGGMVYDLGCYCTSLILSLVNSEVDMVKAVAEMTDKGVDYSTAAILRFDNGVRAAFNCGMTLMEGGRYDRLYVKGTKGTIVSPVEYNGCGNVSYDVTIDGVTKKVELDVPNNYKLEIENFGRAVAGEDTPYVTEAFTFKNAALLDAILKEIDY